MLRVSMLSLFCFIGAGLVAVPTVPAAMTEAELVLKAEASAIARINFAGRQRFLVQKVSRSACFAMTTHKPEENALQAWQSLETYNNSFEILVDGSEELGFAPEQDPIVAEMLDEGAQDWNTFEAATRQIVSGDWHSIPVAQVLQLNDGVSAHTIAIVAEIVRIHSSQLETQKAYASTVNIAGRQRMLTHKAAKEMCFISLGIQSEEKRATLRETIDLFTISLKAMENGDFDMGVIDPPSFAVLTKIADVRTHWDAFSAVLERTQQGEMPTAEEMTFIEAESDTLFQLSDELVQLYIK